MGCKNDGWEMCPFDTITKSTEPPGDFQNVLDTVARRHDLLRHAFKLRRR